mmetsp:Transcript_72620/g.121147  ORF Transcript_72620/g.121147 Transcript_72620/m.121147 type:complete len:251 (-) Transcript_72620:189-941(-)|eukprot:CAMPEP_0119315946 /NCGR_PEP_ID=MMETSP1333-20130426/37874_1 /TAXON_ID=418940 /ORGANISM="Scyphosphaera apsteinii, Strain RCC1455" /LENGTH=250 /DNA_ID=CAMNT_0007321451 /DNA_START=106 /DNA_END=858 /DNA_ORIENTATION=-
MSVVDSLSIIGAGCGRTGTLSLKQALELLGFPCYHMFECGRLGHASLWCRALTGSPSSQRGAWQDIFAGFYATVDFPAATAYEELMAHYPNAKVILTVRDPNKWAKSVTETIWSGKSKELSWLVAPWFPSFQRMARAYRARFFNDSDGGIASGAIKEQTTLAEKFNEWNTKVKATVPPDRLLVFEVSDGWEPLCKFLGVPVPEVPYPQVNDTAEMKRRIIRRWWICAAANAAIVGVITVGAKIVARKLRA